MEETDPKRAGAGGEADAPRRIRSVRLMYTPHPETNRYPTVIPEHRADTTDRTDLSNNRIR